MTYTTNSDRTSVTNPWPKHYEPIRYPEAPYMKPVEIDWAKPIKDFSILSHTDLKLPVFQHDKLVTELIRKGKHIYATGSRVTTHFKPDSDYDYVVLDPEYKLCTEYERQGWVIGGSGNRHNPDFNSIKATDIEGITVNLICVSEKETFNKYVMASDLIRTVDPETKEERVKLFDLIFKNSDLPF